MLIQIFENILIVIVLLFGVPFLFTVMLSKLNQETKSLVASHLGIRSQVFIGGIGVMIHEALHWLMALIFRHRIDSVRLIKFPTQDEPTLGYVNHSWNPNSIYQRTGNLFIGLAPTFGCSLIMLLAYKILFPISFSSAILAVRNSDLQAFSLPEFSVAGYVIFILLAITICVGGFDLSSADFNNAKQGLIPALITVIVITVLLSLTSLFSGILTGIIHFIIGIAIILAFNLVISIIINWLAKLL